MKRIVVIAVLVACDKGRSTQDDCALIAKDPANAMVALSKRYPGDPVKVAETIERCVASVGDECTRVADLVKAIPTMMPSLSAPRTKGDYADLCRRSPPDLRRCFLPSYAIAHAEECKSLRDKLAGQLELKPPGTRPGEACNGGSLAIYVTGDGTWLATGKDAASRCFAARKGGELDHAWLEAELSQFKNLPCQPGLELASDAGVLYRDVIHAMDVAVKVGLSNVGLSTLEDLGVSMKDANAEKASAHCPATTIALEPGSAASPPPTRPAAGSGDLAKLPVVVITRDEITLGGTRIATLEEVADGTGPFDALAKALPPTRDGTLILQADESTASNVINRVVTAAKAAGFDNVMFAVKRR